MKRRNLKAKQARLWTLTTEVKQQLKGIGANYIPPMPFEAMFDLTHDGSTLLNQGVTHVKKGKLEIPVMIGQQYVQKVPALKNADHYLHLKEAYQKNGIMGVTMYMEQCKKLLAKAKLMYPSLFDEEGNYKGVQAGTVLKPDKAFTEGLRNAGKVTDELNKENDG